MNLCTWQDIFVTYSNSPAWHLGFYINCTSVTYTLLQNQLLTLPHEFKEKWYTLFLIHVNRRYFSLYRKSWRLWATCAVCPGRGSKQAWIAGAPDYSCEFIEYLSSILLNLLNRRRAITSSLRFMCCLWGQYIGPHAHAVPRGNSTIVWYR